MELEKLPVPAPSIVLVFKLMLGEAAVFHTTPLDVISAPPSLAMVPPLVALFKVMFEIVEVETCGAVFVEAFSLAQPNKVVITKKSGAIFFIEMGVVKLFFFLLGKKGLKICNFKLSVNV
jgi:hypothetical protein